MFGTNDGSEIVENDDENLERGIPNKRKDENIPELDAKISEADHEGKAAKEKAKNKLQKVKEQLMEGVKTIDECQKRGDVNIPELADILSKTVKKASDVVDKASKAEDHFKYGQSVSYEIIQKRIGGPRMKVATTENHLKCNNCDFKCMDAASLSKHRDEFHRQEPQRSPWQSNERTTQVCIQSIYSLYVTHNCTDFLPFYPFFYCHYIIIYLEQ